MYTATFTFAPGTYDDDFHALDAVIARVAKSIPGYRGEETWHNPDTGQVCNVYHWDSLQALQQLMDHPAHRTAKQQQGRWLQGYRVTVAQVLRTYGDGGLDGPAR
jgi:heme-degrading monooxygenase HmoA